MAGVLDKHYDDKNMLVKDLCTAVKNLGDFYKEHLKKCEDTSQIYTLEYFHAPQANSIKRSRWNKEALADAERSLYDLVQPSLGKSPLDTEHNDMAKETIRYIRVSIPNMFDRRREELKR